MQFIHAKAWLHSILGNIRNRVDNLSKASYIKSTSTYYDVETDATQHHNYIQFYNTRSTE